MSNSKHSAHEIVTINIVVVVKSVRKIVVIMVFRFEQYSAGNEEWDDFRISNVQSRSQL